MSSFNKIFNQADIVRYQQLADDPHLEVFLMLNRADMMIPRTVNGRHNWVHVRLCEITYPTPKDVYLI